jgi:hypothetical protein
MYSYNHYINDHWIEIARLIFSVGSDIILKKYKTQFKIEVSYLNTTITDVSEFVIKFQAIWILRYPCTYMSISYKIELLEFIQVKRKCAYFSTSYIYG